ncbi:MAG: MBL fold metallo-hydrolase, partial [Oscillospiraceae bacterium]
MARFVTLYSGSSGNSTLVTEEADSVLVDMGCSCKRTLGALYSLGLAASDLKGILVTHEHSDHVSGLMTFLKHYRVPVYGSYQTLCWLKNNGVVPDKATLIDVAAGDAFYIGGIEINAFPTSHDSVDCVGYRFSFKNGKKLALATDLGFVSEEVLAALSGCELVALESNYEDDMLLSGHYPYFLKSRI